MRNILHRENLKLIYIFVFFVFIFFLVFYIENLLLSCVLAFVIYYLLSPIINFCERKGLSRSLSIFTIYTINTAFVIFCFYIFIPLIIDQLSLLEKELPQLQEGVLNLVTRAENKIKNIFHIENMEFRKNIGDWMISQTSEYTSLIPKWVSDSLTTLFLTPFLAFFMLRDGSQMKRSLLTLIPNSVFEVFLKMIYEMNDQIGSFIRARIAEALIVGFVTWIGLLIIGFPYAALLALFAAITNLIPYLGPIIGAIPAVLIVLVNSDIIFDSISMNLLAIAIVYLAAQLFDAFFIIPVVVAKIVNLHPVTVILVIILGAQVLGVLGMIISIPVASLLKLFFTTVYQQTIRPSP